jgi:HKD family nuclease
MNRFLKQPSEKFTITVDFASVLATNETISSYIITCVDLSDDSDSSSIIIDSDSNTTNAVSIKVKAGIDKENHKITVKITTSDSNIFEEDILMKVREDNVL